ncbi:TRAM domain-containing protein, partial [Candidatus Saccharibacteria bacterium]|nr:TRAM domain-containing protein [Candidatus Saccharibacteria bacterium]
MKRIIEEVVKLEQLVPGGQAIGNLADGRKVFVWGALPGETALVRLTKLKKTHAEAIVTEVIKPSELQQEMIKGLAERAEDIRSGGVDPKVDNMLRITNDEQFNHRMTSPKHKVAKIYRITLKPPASDSLCSSLKNGVLLHD